MSAADRAIIEEMKERQDLLMNQKMYQLLPLFREKIWGGTKLKEEFGYAIPSDKTGEAWVVTSLAGNEDNQLAGCDMTLSQLYSEHRELFGTANDICPIKTTIIDANDDLSVQCHPNDDYARRHDHSLGKPEAWYILAAEPQARIEFGHKAKDKKELAEMIAAGQWDRLLNYVKPQVGDFLFVPDGTMHAIGRGTLVFEVSRNADLTYRVYDYDRVGADGQKRELHIAKSLDVLKAPFNEKGLIHPQSQTSDGLQVTTYYDVAGQFTFRKLQAETKGCWYQDEFMFVFVAGGQGRINGQPVSKGQSWFVPCHTGQLVIEGPLTLLVSSYRPLS